MLFELTLGRLLYSGLFNFSLFLAAIFAIAQNLEQIGVVSIEDWLTPERAESAQGYFNVRLALVLVPCSCCSAWCRASRGRRAGLWLPG